MFKTKSVTAHVGTLRPRSALFDSSWKTYFRAFRGGVGRRAASTEYIPALGSTAISGNAALILESERPNAHEINGGQFNLCSWLSVCYPFGNLPRLQTSYTG
jgi:hypothetical protein